MSVLYFVSSRVGNDGSADSDSSCYKRFQSTFPRGERRLCVKLAISKQNFNPRSRVGNDLKTSQYGQPRLEISIHVPAWGTTRFIFLIPIIHLFQSTFPRGERLKVCQLTFYRIQFQSTFPRGERRP